MQKISDLFIDNVNNLPIWVKQVLAVEVSRNLVSKLGEFNELIQSSLLLQYMIPSITLKGQHELENRTLKLSDGFYVFLNSIAQKENIFEITLKNNWTLADSSKILCKLVDLGYVEIPENQLVNYALAEYIANRLKTGEFLKRIGKISSNELDDAIKYQKDLKNDGIQIKMASALIKMGFISEFGLDSLLLMKEESKRRLTPAIGLTSFNYNDVEDSNNYNLKLQKEISRLENENLIMKKRLRKLLNVND